MTESWGRYPAASHVAEVSVVWRSEASIPPLRPVLAYGRGRSYGDSCLNDGGALLRTATLDRFISFDADAGTLRCEAGVTLGEILELAVPRDHRMNSTESGLHACCLAGGLMTQAHPQ